VELLADVLRLLAEYAFTKAADPLLAKVFSRSAVERATERTAGSVDITGLRKPAVSVALENWIGSDTFEGLLRELKAGSRLLDEKVVAAFIQVTGFDAGDRTSPLAREVLRFFSQFLLEELYSTEAGLAIHANREEVLHGRNLAATLETREEVRQLAARMEARDPVMIAELQRVLEPRLVAVDRLLQQGLREDPGYPRDERDRVYHTRIDEAKKLLDEGRPEAARQLLSSIRGDLSREPASADLTFRVAMNVGVAAVMLNDIPTAVEEFDRARALKPESAKALTNSAMAALVQGRYEDALGWAEQAHEREPRNGQAAAMLLQALERLGRHERVAEFVANEPWTVDDPSCLVALGAIETRKGNYGQAEQKLRRALAITPEDPQVLALLTEAILVPVFDRVNEDPPLPSTLPQPDRDKLDEARRLLDQAILRLDSRERDPRLAEALVNRATVRTLLDETDAALDDLGRVLGEDPAHAAALRAKAKVLLRKGNLPEAAAALERVLPAARGPEILLPLAAIYGELGEARSVPVLIEPIWVADSPDRTQLHIAAVLLKAYDALRDESAARRVREAIRRNWPSDPDALIVLADHSERQGLREDAIALLQEALASSKGRSRDRAASALADLYIQVERYGDAAELLEKVADVSRDTGITRRYLVCLLNAGYYREALDLARRLRGSGRPLPVVTEVEIRILEFIGDIGEARKLLEQLSDIEPSEVRHRLRLAGLAVRRGDRDGAREVLRRIRDDEVRDNSHHLMQLAQIRAWVGEPNALPAAYEARRLGYADPKIHLAYIGVVMACEKWNDPLLQVEAAHVGATVVLRRDDETKRFTVVAKGEAPYPGDVEQDTVLGEKLQGLRKGQTIQFVTGPFEESPYEVAEVQSKYVAAVQETFTDFTTLFPGHPGFHKVEIKDKDITKILAAVERRRDRVTQAASLYLGRKLTLGALAKFTGSTLVEAWAGMISLPDGHIIASRGDAQERERESRNVSSAEVALVLDLTALLTLNYLGLLERLPKQFPRLIVPQQVLDQINDSLASAEYLPDPAMFLAKVGEAYVREEITPEALAQSRKRLETIRDFVLTNTSVEAVQSILKLGRDRYAELEDVLGKESVAAVLRAGEGDAVLYSDDLGLREIGQSDWNVKGVWTHAVLERMRDSGVLSQTEFCEAVSKLAVARYHFLPVAPDILLGVLWANGMDVTSSVVGVFELLAGGEGETTEESAVAAAAELLRMLWLEPVPLEKRLAILDLTLHSITKGRLPVRVISALKRRLRGRLSLLPVAEQQIFETIDLWVRQQALRGRLLP
jgi:tetratricopeptide (TPR) repeat protein